MEVEKEHRFRSLSENVGRFKVRDKTFLIPQMNRNGAHLLAGVFRGFSVKALVMDTYEALDLGKEFTSGKECFPCQVTMGDILHHMKKEQEKLGENFDPEEYIYFMPEAGGPCRFGMYNKYQRIVLDSFPELKELKIAALTADDGYSLSGMIEKEQIRDFRKVAYLSVIIGDILDRLLWKIRPYERREGKADEFIENAMKSMADCFETNGPKKDFDVILHALEEIIKEGKEIIDPSIPSKPTVGIVGEIYLRTHVQSNQDVIRVLERYGAEVVNASISEWINYVTYDRLREAKIGLVRNLKQFRIKKVKDHILNILNHGINLHYQQVRQEGVYKRVKSLIDLPGDHRVGHLEKILLKEDQFSFDVGTEACLSIAGIMEYMKEGYNGVVNVYPFTCMPSLITSAVVKPHMNQNKVPYLDTPYDGTFQPGGEAAIRTFMYQVLQHYNRNGGKEMQSE